MISPFYLCYGSIKLYKLSPYTKVQVSLPICREDWKPRAGDGDSQDDSLPLGDTQVDLPGQPLVEEFQEPMDTLDILMGDLETKRPPVPVPGPGGPQVPSPLGNKAGQSSQPETELPKKDAEVKKVIPTPCRSTPTLQAPGHDPASGSQD